MSLIAYTGETTTHSQLFYHFQYISDFYRTLKLQHKVLNAACRQRTCTCCRLYDLICGNKHRVNFHIRVPPANLELFIQRHCLKCIHNPFKVRPCRCVVMPCGKDVGGICAICQWAVDWLQQHNLKVLVLTFGLFFFFFPPFVFVWRIRFCFFILPFFPFVSHLTFGTLCYRPLWAYCDGAPMTYPTVIRHSCPFLPRV